MRRAAGWAIAALGVGALNWAHAGRPASDVVPDEVDVLLAPPPPPLEPTLPPATYGAQVPDELRQVVRNVLALPSLRGAQVGLHAVRLSDGKPLVSVQPDMLLNPASCTKLFTTAAALKLLKPRYRFSTEFLVRGPLDAGVLKGDLYVRGTGDPTFNSARLYKVATELQARGLSTITGDLVMDDSYFDRQGEPPGWDQESQPDRAYAAPNGALSLEQNAVSVYVRPGNRRGDRAVVQVEPASDSLVVESQVITVRWGRRVWVRTLQDGDKTRVVVQGVIGVREPTEKLRRRIYEPALHFGYAFRQMLKSRGIKVKGRVRLGVTPENAKAMWTSNSVSLREVVTVLNHHSSNFTAEMLLKAVGAAAYGAPATTQKGLTAVQDVMQREFGMPAGSFIMGNGSGLNDVNRFSARQIATLLAKMAQDPQLGPEFVTSLAVAGNTGTLSHRMAQSGADGVLRGKTGTLMGVSALSGYVQTPRSGPVAFSIMVNGLSGPASTGWEMQDRIGMAIAGDYSGGAFARGNPTEMPAEDSPGGGGQ